VKYHIIFKFLAILLCACALLAFFASALSIYVLSEVGLYSNTLEEIQLQQMELDMQSLGHTLANRYATQSLSNVPDGFLDIYNPLWKVDDGTWYYNLKDDSGSVLDFQYISAISKRVIAQSFVVSTQYPWVISHEQCNTNPTTNPISTTSPTEETVPETTAATSDEPLYTLPPVSEGVDYSYIENFEYMDTEGNEHYMELGICDGPTYSVTLFVLPEAFIQNEYSWLLNFGYTHRYHVIWLLAGSLLLFAITATYLCCAAGRTAGTQEIRPGGFNRLPLDLYAAAITAVILAMSVVTLDVIQWELSWDATMWPFLMIVCLMAFAACLLIVAFCFACAAQFKTPGGFWYRRTVIGGMLLLVLRLMRGVFALLSRFAQWCKKNLPPAVSTFFKRGISLVKKLFTWAKQFLTALWRFMKLTVRSIFTLLGKFFAWLWHVLQRFAALLPLTWQWLLVGFLQVFLLVFSLSSYNRGMQLLGVTLCIAVVVYGAHCFGVLLENTKRMSRGDLDTQVDDKLFLGCFQEYATHLNALADVAVEAAKRQMKSERMKAELITNVSHDIKTPLTSIINYVDLLQKADSQAQAEEYLEVLSRQSLRLKKLIEDLMEMSKASTGNMPVELTSVDAAEAINQALGEFADKLEATGLVPVFCVPEQPIIMRADGRLTWRVLSNLLINAVKYALPSTRLYIDLVALNGKVLISLKNISREQLNVSSDELMERFVRGDASRNTEGSGLGLNIAKSLMELQGGQLQLLVDGDLFKVMLIFPEA